MLLLLSLLFTLPLIKPPDRIAVWGRSRVVMNLLGLSMSLAGAFVAIYTGLAVAYERGIPFWHSAAVPLLALFLGVAAGSGVYGLLGKREAAPWIAAGSGLAALTYLAHLHLSSIGPEAAAYSAQGAMSDPAALGGIALALAAALALGGRKPGVVAPACWRWLRPSSSGRLYCSGELGTSLKCTRMYIFHRDIYKEQLFTEHAKKAVGVGRR
nr:hypothetical protein [Pyrobaculum neutrophilum]